MRECGRAGKGGRGCVAGGGPLRVLAKKRRGLWKDVYRWKRAFHFFDRETARQAEIAKILYTYITMEKHTLKGYILSSPSIPASPSIHNPLGPFFPNLQIL